MASMSPDINGLERLDIFKFRLCPHERADAMQAIDHLRIHRLLDPERAVLVKRGDAFLRRHEVGAARVVVVWTKLTMACLAAPSFHEGNGSWARTLVKVKATAPTSAAASRFCLPRRLVAPKHRSVGGSAAKAGVHLVFIVVSFRMLIGFSN